MAKKSAQCRVLRDMKRDARERVSETQHPLSPPTSPVDVRGRPVRVRCCDPDSDPCPRHRYGRVTSEYPEGDDWIEYFFK